MLKSQSQQCMTGRTLFVDTRDDESNQTRTWLSTTNPASHCFPSAVCSRAWALRDLLSIPFPLQTNCSGWVPSPAWPHLCYLLVIVLHEGVHLSLQFFLIHY